MLAAHSIAVIVVNSVFPFIAVLSVALRLYARKLKAMSLKSSDYVILVALVGSIFQANRFQLT